MKVAVINGSPKLDKGNTSLILNPFLKGLESSGCEINNIEVVKRKISPCNGDFICCTKTPGKCFKNDDMSQILPILEDSDLWVISTPLYCDGVTAYTKIVLDRIVPLLSPLFELRDGHCRHPWRNKEKQKGNVILVSSCGHWELDNFDPIIQHIKAFSLNAGKKFAGSLLRPHASVLKQMRNDENAADIFDAAYKAGIEFCNTGDISGDLCNTVSRELVSQDIYINSANSFFEQLSL